MSGVGYGCGDGWLGSAHTDQCLWLSQDAREFEDACTVCQSMGAQLAAPSTAFKQHLMAGFVDADHARGACACAVTHARVL